MTSQFPHRFSIVFLCFPHFLSVSRRFPDVFHRFLQDFLMFSTVSRIFLCLPSFSLGFSYVFHHFPILCLDFPQIFPEPSRTFSQVLSDLIGPSTRQARTELGPPTDGGELRTSGVAEERGSHEAGSWGYHGMYPLVNHRKTIGKP